MDARSGTPLRRLAAVWCADIAGGHDTAGESPGPELVKLFRRIALDVAEQDYEGRVVELTDQVALAEFTSTGAALRSAVQLMETYQREARAAGYDSTLRIGVHLGEVVARADGEVYGDGVKTAQRLYRRATPGQVLVSEDVWRQLRTRPEFRFESLGEVELRGVTARIAVFDVLFESRRSLLSGPDPLSDPVEAPQDRSGWPGYRPRGWHVAVLLVAVAGAIGLGFAAFGGSGTDAPAVGVGEQADAPVQGQPTAPVRQPTVTSTPAAPDRPAATAGVESVSSEPEDAGVEERIVPPADPRVDRELAVEQALATLYGFAEAVETECARGLGPRFGLNPRDRDRLEAACASAGNGLEATVEAARVRGLDAQGAQIDFILLLTSPAATAPPTTRPFPVRAAIARDSVGWRIRSITLRN